jgi:hypothetical protein
VNQPSNPNSFRTGPDEQGMFGIFGGRFVAETLMPLILELEEAWTMPRPIQRSRPSSIGAFDALHRSAIADLFRRAADRGTGRREDLLQARRAQSHRLAQDQQLPRPDPARPPDGQDRALSPRPARASMASPSRRLRPLRLCRAKSTWARPMSNGRRRTCSRMKLLGAKINPVTSGARHAERRDERGAARLGHQCSMTPIT